MPAWLNMVNYVPRVVEGGKGIGSTDRTLRLRPKVTVARDDFREDLVPYRQLLPHVLCMGGPFSGP